MIKYNNKTINKLEHNASEVKKMYYDSDVCYGGDGGSPEPPTPPSFDGKWLATYDGGTTSSAECDASSAITQYEILKDFLQSVEIGQCVTSIGASAFTLCYDLTSVTIPDSVTSISSGAFEGCSILNSIDIPDSVQTIGGWAFRDCGDLRSVKIGSGVTAIANFAFDSCRSLTSIIIEATTPPMIASTTPFDNTNNCPIYVPAQSVSAYQNANYWRNLASRIQSIPQ